MRKAQACASDCSQARDVSQLSGRSVPKLEPVRLAPTWGSKPERIGGLLVLLPLSFIPYSEKSRRSAVAPRSREVCRESFKRDIQTHEISFRHDDIASGGSDSCMLDVLVCTF
jgi:hypothetical protein